MSTTVDLATTARALVPRGKGILAIDETPGTIGKRFEALGIPSTAQTRCASYIRRLIRFCRKIAHSNGPRWAVCCLDSVSIQGDR